ncbi:MAG: diaminopimelate decarboxylase [Ignavibacteriales bacterium]|nr:diaminopimelate decarboxylase [Ignavibacteriales bacterium]
MQLFDSEYFTYKENKLFCENVSLEKIAQEVATPVFVYSKKFMIDRYKELNNAFENIPHKIYYACKANYNINIIKLFNDLGAGIDVNSAGEFYRSLKAGANPKNLIFSGVGKTKDEIELVLENELKLIKAESYGEIELINSIAKKLGKIAPIAIRVNPNVDPATHPYISTGLAENKFGIDETTAIEIFTKAAKLGNIQLLGIDMHIGSQITKIEPYIEAAEKLVKLVEELKAKGISLTHIDLGGGMGIKYLDEKPFTAKEYADAVIPILKKTDCEIFIEPGRYLTANSGCLLSEVLYVKNNLDKNFIIADAAMTELLRPSIYKAYHHIQPVNISINEEFTADIVGPVCESGDFLGKHRKIKKVKPNDLLAVMSAGAYGMVMASNYNARLKPAEVLVDNEKFYIIRKRETLEQLVQNEFLI